MDYNLTSSYIIKERYCLILDYSAVARTTLIINQYNIPCEANTKF